MIHALQPFRDVFYHEDQDLTFTHEVKHKIDTIDEHPIHQKTYKYPYHLRNVVSAQIQNLLEMGVVLAGSKKVR